MKNGKVKKILLGAIGATSMLLPSVALGYGSSSQGVDEQRGFIGSARDRCAKLEERALELSEEISSRYRSTGFNSFFSGGISRFIGSVDRIYSSGFAQRLKSSWTGSEIYTRYSPVLIDQVNESAEILKQIEYSTCDITGEDLVESLFMVRKDLKGAHAGFRFVGNYVKELSTGQIESLRNEIVTELFRRG